MKVKIDGKYYINFNQLRIQLRLDSIASTFEFVFRPELDNPDHQKLITPLTYKKVEIYDEDDSLFLTGTVISHKFMSRANPELIGLSGYSLPGVLADCNLPTKNYPLEHSGRNLREIVQKVIQPFGIQAIFESSVSSEVSKKYKKSTLDPDTKVGEYISKLSAQRNVLVSHNEKGQLVFYRPSDKGTPKQFYNVENCLDMDFEINGQELHSQLSVLKQPSKDSESLSLQDSATNPMVKAFRPAVRKLSKGEDSDVKESAKNFMANELRAIKLSISLNRWDKLRLGDLVEVENPEVQLRNRTKFMISEIDMNEDATSKTMSLSCLLPETFTGNAPKDIFL